MSRGHILVVGGAGFIGSHVNQMLHESGYQTIVFDNLSRGFRQAVSQGVFIKGDMHDTSLLHHLFTEYKIQAVMHFASFIDVGESVTNPLKYYLNNVSGTLQLLQVMSQHEVKAFIFSSSAAVYGIPEMSYINESHPCKPINPYGKSKLLIEDILHDIEIAHGIRSCSLRYFNAAGGDPKGCIKNYRQQESNLIPKILRHIQKAKAVKIYGTNYPTPDGTCIRDYIHVADLGSAHITAMEQLIQGGPSTIYNLGNGKGFSVKEVLATAGQITGKKIEVLEDARRAGDPPILVADSAKAKQFLNWKPQYPALEKIIADAWKAMQ